MLLKQFYTQVGCDEEAALAFLRQHNLVAVQQTCRRCDAELFDVVRTFLDFDENILLDLYSCFLDLFMKYFV